MTTITATINPVSHEITLAGDCRYTEGTEGSKYWDSPNHFKVATRGDVAFGVAGDQPIVQHIIYGWEPPAVADGDDPILTMHASLLPSLKEHVGDMDGEWEMIVGFNQSLFYCDKNGFTGTNDRTAAIGEGAPYALGFLEADHDDMSMAACTAIIVASMYTTSTSVMHNHVYLHRAPLT